MKHYMFIIEHLISAFGQLRRIDIFFIHLMKENIGVLEAYKGI